MTLRDTTPVGAPCWADLMTSEPERSRDFYCQLFGWTCEDPGADYGGYFNFLKDGRMVAGGMRADEGGVADVWSVYLATDDIEKAAATAEANGGSVMVPPMAVMDLGHMAVLTDAGQAAIGLWQPGTHTGFGVVDEPGSPSWFELHTRDYAASLDFYRQVAGWDITTVADEPFFKYATLGEDDAALAGIMDATAFLPEGMPAHWSVYWSVADPDVTLAEVTRLGGQVLMPTDDTPYGRLATAADPMGGVFKLRAL